MRKVAIYGQPYTITSEKEISELIFVLEKRQIEVYFEKQFYLLLSEKVCLERDYKTFKVYEDLSSDFGAMFTIGGDGTFLRAITYVRDLGIPIIGINTGRLGFLATIQKTQISYAVELLFKGLYTIKERSLLKVETMPKFKELEDLDIALNEVTVVRKNTASMIGIKTFLNEDYLTDYWADGLIIATPTGSTGYSLSCNGPVVLPGCKSLILNPIAPHNLSTRPMIINDDLRVELKVDCRGGEYLMTLDSRTVTLPVETKIKIEKANYTINTVVFENQTFLNTLRDKLLWGVDTRNKSTKT